MKTVNDIAAFLTNARGDAEELADKAAELHETLDAIQKSLRDVLQNGPLMTTLHTNDASRIRKFLEDYRNVLYATGVSNTAVINRLIDLLPSK